MHSVMVVDDDLRLLALLEGALGREFQLVLCRDARSALEALKCHTPDMLLLDLALPDGDGFEVLEELSKHHPTPAVVVMSGTAAPAQSFRLAQLGVHSYLSKPFELFELREAIERAVHSPLSIEPQLRTLVGQRSIHEVEAEVRSTMLTEALARSGGSRRAAARLLSVSRQLVQHMLRKAGI